MLVQKQQTEIVTGECRFQCRHLAVVVFHFDCNVGALNNTIELQLDTVATQRPSMRCGTVEHIDRFVVVHGSGAFLKVGSSEHSDNGVAHMNGQVGSEHVGHFGNQNQPTMVSFGVGKLGQFQTKGLVVRVDDDPGANILNTVLRILRFKAVNACRN